MNTTIDIVRDLPEDWTLEDEIVRACVVDAVRRAGEIAKFARPDAPSSITVAHCDRNGEDGAGWHAAYHGDPAGRCLVVVRVFGVVSRYHAHAQGVYGSRVSDEPTHIETGLV